MRITGYAYPWDVLDDPDFARRAVDLGVEEVAVALAYHSARAATPHSPHGTSVLARHAALYRPVREEAWREAALRPAAPDWVRGPDSGGEALRLLAGSGLRTAAWLVLTHNSLLGNAHPDCTVTNCFGEHYPWALCPAEPRVRAYAATLTAESLRGTRPDTVVLEACGPLGAVHQHQHEKTDAVWSPAVQRLLSVCCCPSCARAWSAAGLDPQEVRARLRAETHRLLHDEDLTTEADALPEELRRLLLTTRQSATDRLRHAVLEAVPTGVRRVLHASPDPWATGALPGLTPAAAEDVDAVVAPAWVPGAESVRTAARARALLPERVALGSYVTAVAPAPVPAEHIPGLARAGAAELHLYHLGLAGPARRPDLRTACEAARKAGGGDGG
ncbi:hypothetical protein [Streptomyces sp. SCSIO ZS0520]|uniref:hypothetical protein n=1 Tax=Streptomyces sp. SCSIO ZS0520 TaxID=2892996 RepID=UPI0021D816C6|nr:hypothetical protein [Streptomyces sp. SCSIO ZS0520]